MDKILLNDGNQIPVIGFGPGGAGYSAKYKKSPKSKFIALSQRVWNKFISRPLILAYERTHE